MAKESVGLALKDGGLKYQEIEQAIVGYVFGNKNPRASFLQSHSFAVIQVIQLVDKELCIKWVSQESPFLMSTTIVPLDPQHCSWPINLFLAGWLTAFWPWDLKKCSEGRCHRT